MEVIRGKGMVIRTIVLSMWTVVHFLLLLLTIPTIQEGAFAEGFSIILLLSVFWSSFTYIMLWQIPKVTLSEDGVMVQVLVRKRFFNWKEIKQAGILWRMGRGTWYNQIVLVQPNGSRRRYRDKVFLLRNIGRLIVFEKTEEARSFITKHYGPLDFDLSDGQLEQSTVAD